MLYPIQNSVRNKLDLSGIWDFRTDPQDVGVSEQWYNGLSDARPMAVPGSWNEQYEDLYSYLDTGWYVRRFFVARSWQGQRVFLRVGSANYAAEVYVNGVHVGGHQGGHLPFAIDVSAQLHYDRENTVAISVENQLTPTRVPSGNMPNSSMSMFASTPRTTFDFYPFAGIHRPVVLYSVPQTAVEDVTVTTEINGSDGLVNVAVLLNTAYSGSGSLQLRGNGGQLEQVLHFVEGRAQAQLTVAQARLWSDRDPYLYELTVNAAEDSYSLAIGIRTIAVRGGEILLNGQPVKLNGFGRHEDFIASGKGLNLPLMVKDYQLMRWTGANSYRTSHYPYSEEEMQLADREGFLIIDETPAVSLQFDSDENMAARMQVCLQQIDELIARDKNHPSVIAWCVANEPMPRNLNLAGGLMARQPVNPQAATDKAFLDRLLQRARELDASRLVTLVTVMGGPQEWMEQCDFICMNRYWGWYVLGGQLPEARTALEQELDQVWARFSRPIVITEFGADTMAGMHGHPNVMWTEEYQADFIRFHLEVAAARPFIAGMQVWNFADFAAVQSIMRVGGLNMKGIFTRTRQPKMAAHVLREFWRAGK
jgi:beta-glucuronidase